MKQHYEFYEQEDFEVWNLLYLRQIKQLALSASTSHLEGLKKVTFNEDEIPKFDQINHILIKETGWELVVVPGLVPDYTFFELMSNKKFPATTWLRKMKELDYLKEPDMFHDVFAHVPLLTNQFFVDFLMELSKIGLRYCGDDAAINMLSRVYWYTVEFGLIREHKQLKIYGAGILSSAGETFYCLSDQPKRYEFDVQHIMNTGYRKDVFQDVYFVINSYEQLYQSIPEIDRVMLEMFPGTLASNQ
jgi:phenylalanine-4-hydroxylase